MAHVTPPTRYETELSAGLVAAGAETTLPVASVALPSAEEIDFAKIGGRLYLTINPGGSTEEYCYVTGRSGNTYTGLVRGLSYQGAPTADDSRKLPHSAGEPVVATDYGGWFSNMFDPTAEFRPQYSSSPTFGAGSELHLIPKEYADALAIAGAPNASTTQKGIVEEATDAETTAETETGGTGARLFVTPAKMATYLRTAAPSGFLSFTADEDLTAGQPVGISNYSPSGRVARGNRQTQSTTLSVTGENDLTRDGFTFPIGGDKFVMLNSQASDDSLYAVVGTVDTDTKEFTYGTPSAATADVTTPVYSGCKLGTDKFIVFYKEDASSTIVKYRVGTVSGTTISWGSAATFHTAAGGTVDGIAAEFLSTDKGVVNIHTSTNTDSRLIAFTVSSTTATAGTPKALNSNTDDDTGVLCKVSTDKFLFVCKTGGYCVIGTCSGGTTITLGTDAQYESSVGSGNGSWEAVSPTTDVAVISYRKADNTTGLKACTISGTTPTFGSFVQITNNDNIRGMVAESSSVILVNDTNSSRLVKVTRSGTSLTSDGAVIQQFANSIGRLLLTDNSFIIGTGWSGTSATNWIMGMSNMFFGIAQSTVSRGAAVSILFNGKDTHQSGLIQGALYQCQNGAFVKIGSTSITDNPSEKTAQAASATELIIT